MRCHVWAEHLAFLCVFVTAGTAPCLPGWETSGKWCSLHSAWVPRCTCGSLSALLTHCCGSFKKVIWAGVNDGSRGSLAALVTVRAVQPTCHINCMFLEDVHLGIIGTMELPCGQLEPGDH